MQRERSSGGSATAETRTATGSEAGQDQSDRESSVSTQDVDIGHRVPAKLVRSTGRASRGRATERPYCPKVSIIMATYRRQHTIYRTVNKIVAQSYPHWELIVIDNARSGDYRFDDPRIQVYRHAARASASYARNEGIRYATGDLLLFFDDDDDMFPTYLERFVTAFRDNPAAKMVRCGMYRQDGQLNFTYATPECCLRRQFVTPTWGNVGRQDQAYFSDIVDTNGWSEDEGDIVVIPELLVRARSERRGGLRSGRL